jgi:hypothetical protein
MLSLFAQFPIAKAFYQNSSEPVIIKTLSLIKEGIYGGSDNEPSSLHLAYDNLVLLLGKGLRSSPFNKLLIRNRFPFVIDYHYDPSYGLLRYQDGVLIDSLHSFMAWYTNLNQYRKTYVLEKTAFALECSPVSAMYGFSPDTTSVEGSDDTECWMYDEPLTPHHDLWEGFSVQWTNYFDFAGEVTIALAFISGVMMEGVFYPECCFQSNIDSPTLDTMAIYDEKVWCRYRQNGNKYEQALYVPTYHLEESLMASIFYPSPELCEVIRAEMGEHAIVHSPSYHYSGCHINALDFNAGGPIQEAHCVCPKVKNRTYYFEDANILCIYVYEDDEVFGDNSSDGDDANNAPSYHLGDGEARTVLEPTDTRFDHYGEDWSAFDDLSE